MGCRRLAGLSLCSHPKQVARDPLRLVTPIDHDLAGDIDGVGIFGIEQQHGG